MEAEEEEKENTSHLLRQHIRATDCVDFEWVVCLGAQHKTVPRPHKPA